MPENTQPVTTRRRRYERSPSQERLIGLTPTKVQMLHFLAELRFLSLPQLAKLCCPSDRQDLSEKSARRHMRDLFDAGLVNVLPVSRAALAPPGIPNDASLLYGSAPNVYAPTAQGLKLLREAGVIGEELLKRLAPAYGPKNSLFLAHELAVRDVRVWLERCAREGGHAVEEWRDGEEASFDLRRDHPPLWVRPDAWFAYRLGMAVLVGLVEVDRGTERGGKHWGKKLHDYTALFAGGQLPTMTGYRNARLLIIAPNDRRRDHLQEVVEQHAVIHVLSRVWLTTKATLSNSRLDSLCWRRPGNQLLQAIVPSTG